jgi:pilus assembly protein CpaE
MSKIISVTSLRNGVGRSTVTCLIGLKLAQTGYKVLIIDNNYKFCDIAHYLMVRPEYTVDDLKPFLKSGVLEKSTITEIAVTAEKHLDVIAGSTMDYIDNTLNKEDMIRIKNLINDEYNYILIDNKAGIEHANIIEMLEVAELNIIVVQLNAHDQKHYERLLKNLEPDHSKKIANGLEKSIVVYNRFNESASYNFESSKKLFGEKNIFKITFSNAIQDFCNGYAHKNDTDNEKEIVRLAARVAQKETIEIPKTTITQKIKSMFKVS